MTERPDPVTLVGLLMESHRGLIRELGAIHAAHGLQGSEFDALLRLSRSPNSSLRMRDLAAQVGLSTSGTTTLVDRLVAQGWVDRLPDPADRRSLQVHLTDAGAKLLQDDLDELVPAMRRLVADPLGDDAPVVARALTRVRDAVYPAAVSGAQPRQPL